jgi:hypothetical protein
MAADRTRPDSPAAELPERSGQVHPVDGMNLDQALTRQLVPVVDQIRQLAADFGARPYRIFLVHMGWSGNVRGIGLARELARTELIPTPKIQSMDQTTQQVTPFGRSEEGGLRLTEISARYSEDDLLGKTPDMVKPDLPKTNLRNTEFFYEVVQYHTAGQPSRRRYIPESVPDLRATSCQWTINLTKQEQDRTRDGRMDRKDA